MSLISGSTKFYHEQLCTTFREKKTQRKKYLGWLRKRNIFAFCQLKEHGSDIKFQTRTDSEQHPDFMFLAVVQVSKNIRPVYKFKYKVLLYQERIHQALEARPGSFIN